MEIIKDLLGKPAFVAGLVVFIGLLALKKPVTEVIRGTAETIIGFVVMLAGTDIIVKVLNHFGILFEDAFQMTGIVPSNEGAIAIVLSKYGSTTTLIFVLGLILNVVLARLTKYKYIFLSTDHALYMACAITPIMLLAGFSQAECVIFGTMLLGVILCVMPAIAHPAMKTFTGSEEISLAHFGTLGYVFAAQVGKVFGKNGRSRSIEDIQFPRGLGFLQNTNVSVSVVMALLFFIVTVIAGPEAVAELTDENPYVWGFFQAVEFAAGIVILLAGINMMLEEISPAFKGISEKLVPEAVPGYPGAILLKGTANAMLIGFVVSLVGGILAMLLQIALDIMVILPGIVYHFFCGGYAAVFGNITGGRKGAILGPFVNGVIMTFLPVVTITLYQELGFVTTTFSDSDFLVMESALGIIAAGTGKYVFMAVILGIFVLPFLITVFERKRTA